MQYIITAYDATDDKALDRRMAARPEHLSNLEEVKEYAKVLAAGGLLTEEGKMKGSVLIMDFDSREDLDKYMASEPYIREKVWENITIESFNTVILGDK